MFKIKSKKNFKTTNEVVYLRFGKKYLLQVVDNKLTNFNPVTLKIIWSKYFDEKNIYFSYMKENKVGITNHKNTTYEIEIKSSRILKTINKEVVIKKGNYIITQELVEGKAQEFCYEYISRKEVWRTNSSPIFSFMMAKKSDILIGLPKMKEKGTMADKSYFLNADIKTGKTLWTFDCQQLSKYSHKEYPNAERKWHKDEVFKMIGVYENNLWICLYSGKVIGIDVATGQLKHTIELADKIHGQLAEAWCKANELKSWTWRILLKKEEGILYGGRRTYYYEIDLKQTKPYFEVWELPEDQPKIDGGQVSEPLTDTHFFYADNYSGWVCALNRKTLEIDWQHQFHNHREGYFREMKYIDHRLYVLHGEYTGERHHHLYVFEKS